MRKEESELLFYSFWKPLHLAAVKSKILVPLGTIYEVRSRLLSLPHTEQMPSCLAEIVRISWRKKVIIEFQAEPGDLDVLSLRVITTVNDRSLFRLYVQLWEHFSVIILDERQERFFTPNEFRERYN